MLSKSYGRTIDEMSTVISNLFQTCMFYPRLTGTVTAYSAVRKALKQKCTISDMWDQGQGIKCLGVEKEKEGWWVLR